MRILDKQCSRQSGRRSARSPPDIFAPDVACAACSNGLVRLSSRPFSEENIVVKRAVDHLVLQCNFGAKSFVFVKRIVVDRNSSGLTQTRCVSSKGNSNIFIVVNKIVDHQDVFGRFTRMLAGKFKTKIVSGRNISLEYYVLSSVYIEAASRALIAVPWIGGTAVVFGNISPNANSRRSSSRRKAVRLRSSNAPPAAKSR